MQVTFFAPSDPAWPSVLAEIPHDVYHLAAYTAHEARCAGAGARPEGAAIRAAGRVLFVPYLLRPLAGIPGLADIDGRWDATSAYGYPGPVASGADPGFLAAATAAWMEELGARGVVSAFLRAHPLLMPLGGAAGLPGEVVVRGTTVSIDVSQDDGRIWRGLRSSHRQDITRGRRAGLTVDWEPGLHDAAVFAEMYAATMDRRAAAPRHRFAPGYFTSLAAACGDALWSGRVRSANGEILGIGLFSAVGRLGQYLFAATSEAGTGWSPQKLLLYEACSWARDRGAARLHLGGGLGGGDDSLAFFKAGFSPDRHPFSTLHLVPRPDDHAALVAAHRRERGETPEGFFPPYRA